MKFCSILALQISSVFCTIFMQVFCFLKSGDEAKSNDYIYHLHWCRSHSQIYAFPLIVNGVELSITLDFFAWMNHWCKKSIWRLYDSKLFTFPIEYLFISHDKFVMQGIILVHYCPLHNCVNIIAKNYLILFEYFFSSSPYF